QRIIITGAAGGIGSATAETFLKHGASVHLIDVDAERLAQTAERLSTLGPVTSAVSMLETTDACKQAIRAGGDSFSGLVHMAGVFEDDPLDGEHDVWDRAIASNLTNAYDAIIAYREFADASRVSSI